MPILDAILPILLISGVGYGVTRKGLMSEAEISALHKIVFIILLPSLLFINTATANISNESVYPFLLAYYIPAFIVFITSLWYSHRFFPQNTSKRSVFALGSTYSNATIAGIPVCLYGLGESALIPLFVIVAIHNLVLFGAGTFVAESDQLTFRSSLKRLPSILKNLIRNPITASLILGGFFNLLNLPLFTPLEKSITLLGKAGVPIALFVLGANLHRYQIKGSLPQVFVLLGFKLLLLPLLVWLFAFQLFDLDPLWRSVALLTAAMPVGVSAYMFSHQYRVLEDAISSAILISTLLSIISLSLLLSLLG